METLNICPICNSAAFGPYLTCTDFTVSKKKFTIVQCNECGFKFTNPRPDQSELPNYYKAEEYISHTDTKQGLVNWLYHLIRNYTLIKKLQLVIKLSGVPSKKSPKSILDIGCGTGAFLDVCNNAGFACAGIEPDSDARNLAINKYRLDVKAEQELNNIEAGSFDIITLWHVLEHVPNLHERIIKIKQLLKPNGRVIVAVPNCNSFDAKHYGEFWAAYDVPRHLYHFTPKDMERLFKNNNIVIESILPMRFDSFYVSMLSEKYKTGKVNYLNSLWIGFRSNILAIKSGRKFSSQIYIIKL